VKEGYSFKCGEISCVHSVVKDPSEEINNNHCHDVFEILYFVSGSGRYIVEGAEFKVSPGTLMLIRPFAFHCLMLDDDSVYERYLLHFSKGALLGESAKLLENLTSGEEDSGIYYPPISVSTAIISAFERFEYAEGLPEEEKGLFLRMITSEMIILISASRGLRMLYNEEELGARIIRYLDQNIDRELSLDKLAKRFFVSKYYLCRAFKKHNGISVHGYINQKRIMYAKQLIEAGETASGAAYRVGFGDYSAFYRAYVKIVGCCPSDSNVGGD